MSNPADLVSLLPPGSVHAPGVVFGMASAPYHADLSLGSSDHKRLHTGPAEYYEGSRLNPLRHGDSDSPAKKFNRAIHKLRLEGEQAFAEAYAVEPVPAQFPGCLLTAEDLKDYARANGLALSGEKPAKAKAEGGKAKKGVLTKPELAAAIRAHNPDVAIFDDIEAAFKARLAKSGAEPISAKLLEEVRACDARLAANPQLLAAFEGGAAEVSVFWTDAETGVPCKARYDYLKPSGIIDLKGMANERGLRFEDAAFQAIGRYRYDIQAVHYLEGYTALWQAAAEGRVFGQCPLPDGWETFLVDPADVRFAWVFHQTTGAPVSRAFEISADHPGLDRARADVRAARRLYAGNLRRFGTAPWTEYLPTRVIGPDDLPRWLTGESRTQRPAIAHDHQPQIGA
jgi:hypothetical protein